MAAQIDRTRDQYTEKLAKLLPAEGTAAFIAINNMVPNESGADIWILIALIVIAVFVFFWGKIVRKIADPLQLIFLVVGFLIWAANVPAGRFNEYYLAVFGNYWYPFIPAMIAILYSLFIPLVFRRR